MSDAESYATEVAETTESVTMTLLKWAVVLIVIILVLSLIIYTIIQWRQKSKKEPMLISDPRDATKKLKINNGDLPSSGSTGEYAYSFWIFVKDWNYKIGQPKCILFRGDQDCQKASPSVWLYPDQNKLMVRADVHSNGDTPASMNPNDWIKAGDKSQFNVNLSCDIENIPLQRWVHVAVSLWNRTMDVYINGKLVRSCALSGVPVTHDGDLYVTKWSGYSGFISRLKVFDKSLDPSTVYKLYLDGPYSGWWWWRELFGGVKVSVKVEYDDDD